MGVPEARSKSKKTHAPTPTIFFYLVLGVFLSSGARAGGCFFSVCANKTPPVLPGWEGVGESGVGWNWWGSWDGEGAPLFPHHLLEAPPLSLPAPPPPSSPSLPSPLAPPSSLLLLLRPRTRGGVRSRGIWYNPSPPGPQQNPPTGIATTTTTTTCLYISDKKATSYLPHGFGTLQEPEGRCAAAAVAVVFFFPSSAACWVLW